MTEPANPYETPSTIGYKQLEKRQTPLRFAVAAFIGLLGMAAFAMGVLAVIVSYRFLIVDKDTTHLFELIASCVLYLSLGTCWLLSAVLAWRANYRRAITTGLIGLAIAAIIAIFIGW